MKIIHRIAIISVAAVCIFIVSFRTVNAQKTEEATCDPAKSLCFTPNVEIPGLFTGTKTVDETLFGTYVSSFYIFFAGVAGILAVVMIMWGGFHYITSLGNPQRMKEGKDIINNAIIGLILVLTSYLLLRTINPRLTTLIIPPVGYYSPIYQTDIYCNAQDKVNGNTLATDAARKAGKFCTSDGQTKEQLTVEYTNEKGGKQTCVSLEITEKVLNEQKVLTQIENGWQEQLVCFPKQETVQDPKTNTVSSKYLYKLRDVAGTSGVCEDNTMTPDAQCAVTQKMLSLAGGKYLIGACKNSNVAAAFWFVGWTGKDVCHYYQFLNCPTATTEAVSCSAAGAGVNSACWDEKGPRYVADIGGGSLQSYCVEPNISPVIEHVDARCCSKTIKEEIVCSPLSVLTDMGYYNVQCGSFEELDGFFASINEETIQDEIGMSKEHIFVTKGGTGKKDCPSKKCWTTIWLINMNKKLPWE
ncbi:MAG: pilin [Candidatus Kerfeldbacteria bacterium]